MIFFFPLAFSVISVMAFAIFTHERIHWKIILLLLVGLSVGFQFVPAMPIHWMVPLFIQTFVCLCMTVYWKVR